MPTWPQLPEAPQAGRQEALEAPAKPSAWNSPGRLRAAAGGGAEEEGLRACCRVAKQASAVIARSSCKPPALANLLPFPTRQGE